MTVWVMSEYGLGWAAANAVAPIVAERGLKAEREAQRVGRAPPTSANLVGNGRRVSPPQLARTGAR